MKSPPQLLKICTIGKNWKIQFAIYIYIYKILGLSGISFLYSHSHLFFSLIFPSLGLLPRCWYHKAQFYLLQSINANMASARHHSNTAGKKEWAEEADDISVRSSVCSSVRKGAGTLRFMTLCIHKPQAGQWPEVCTSTVSPLAWRVGAHMPSWKFFSLLASPLSCFISHVGISFIELPPSFTEFSPSFFEFMSLFPITIAQAPTFFVNLSFWYSFHT